MQLTTMTFKNCKKKQIHLQTPRTNSQLRPLSNSCKIIALVIKQIRPPTFKWARVLLQLRTSRKTNKIGEFILIFIMMTNVIIKPMKTLKRVKKLTEKTILLPKSLWPPVKCKDKRVIKSKLRFALEML